MSITINDLIYDYPKIRAINNLTLSLEKGTITALVGPNGAGKTTLMKCIAGLEKPFSGRIDINGIDVITRPRECHRMVGFLPDFYGLYHGLKVRQALHYFAAASNASPGDIPRAVENAAERLWLKDKLGSRIEELSRGMRQRLAIAQVLIKSPSYLLLDEPASGLDPGARHELSGLFKQLKSEGITLLVSSHILSELEQYADSLVIMNNGKIIPHSTDVGPDIDSMLITVRMLSSNKPAIEAIRTYPKVKTLEIKGEGISIQVLGGHSDCHKVLKAAINNGCQIYEYRIENIDMQSEYMRVMQMCQGGSNE